MYFCRRIIVRGSAAVNLFPCLYSKLFINDYLKKKKMLFQVYLTRIFQHFQLFNSQNFLSFIISYG